MLKFAFNGILLFADSLEYFYFVQKSVVYGACHYSFTKDNVLLTFKSKKPFILMSLQIRFCKPIVHHTQ